MGQEVRIGRRATAAPEGLRHELVEEFPGVLITNVAERAGRRSDATRRPASTVHQPVEDAIGELEHRFAERAAVGRASRIGLSATDAPRRFRSTVAFGAPEGRESCARARALRGNGIGEARFGRTSGPGGRAWRMATVLLLR
jgi:hypothetical protein